MYKYLILDFGNVIAYPETRKWDITKKFEELIDMNLFDYDKFKEIRKKYKDILSEKIDTLDEEYDMFLRFYNSILSEMNLENYNKKIAEEIAYDRTYNNDKYILFNNVINELKNLKEKYTLILLTDNWPCAIPYLKEKNIYDYFDKIYISSFYGVEKKDGLFFNYPIRDFNIKKGEALFIDDKEENLDIASSYDMDVMLMDRFNEIDGSNYPIISDLFLDFKKTKC